MPWLSSVSQDEAVQLAATEDASDGKGWLSEPTIGLSTTGKDWLRDTALRVFPAILNLPKPKISAVGLGYWFWVQSPRLLCPGSGS